MAKDNLVSKILKTSEQVFRKTFDWVLTHPLGLTAFVLSTNIFHNIHSYISEGNFDLSLNTSLIAGLSLDFIKYFVQKNTASKSDLEKTYPKDIRDIIGEVVAHKEGFDSPITSWGIDIVSCGSSGLNNGGYISRHSINYKNGNSLSLIGKVNKKESIINGAKVNRLLKNKFDFIPDSYDISMLPVFMRGLYQDINDTSLSHPVFFKDVGKDSLESIITGESSSPDYDLIFSDINLEEVFSKLSLIHNTFHETDLKDFKEFRYYNSRKERAVDYNISKDFLYLYNLTRKDIFANADTTLVHGDFHQGNILGQSDVHFIDFDNSCIGIPYEDFIHFAIIDYSIVKGTSVRPELTDWQK